MTEFAFHDSVGANLRQAHAAFTECWSTQSIMAGGTFFGKPISESWRNALEESVEHSKQRVRDSLLYADARVPLRVEDYPNVKKLLLDVCVEMSRGAPPEITDEYHLGFIHDQIRLAGTPASDLRLFDAFLADILWDEQVEYAFGADPTRFHNIAPKGSDGQPLSKLLDLIS